MDTTPEQMSTRMAAGWTVALAGLGAVAGYVWDGPFLAAACMLSLGGGAALGTVLARRRMAAGIREGRDRAASLGYADGLGDMVVLGISAYGVSVFPLAGPEAVDPAERAARRAAAYRLTAAEGVPHPVREAAAAALEAIDDARDREAQAALAHLVKTVQRQRGGAG
ncbi:hypothetical protein [uncultured Streptomyces sp.]|uniref:hypothetical protein n=1 Tax=uncultured Streptomyces sp. TaxID=174707 RepID=UPI00263734B1|nr:hypothetical protein [uncultured Streptomyces sp.]